MVETLLIGITVTCLTLVYVIVVRYRKPDAKVAHTLAKIALISVTGLVIAFGLFSQV